MRFEGSPGITEPLAGEKTPALLSGPSAVNGAIPKRIMHKAPSADLPLLARAAVANVRLLNPDFEYVFFDDAAVEQFIDAHYPQYRRTFDAFSLRIQRSDFFRYLAIYHYGGFYLDTDVLLGSTLSPLLKYGCVFPFERLTWSDFLRHQHRMDWEIGTYAFGATPRHPFLRAIIDNCVKAQQDPRWAEAAMRSLPWVLRREQFVIYTTGPGLVSRTLAEYADVENPVHVLFPENVCDKSSWNTFGNYGVHLCASTWRRKHGRIRSRLIHYHSLLNERRAMRFASKLGKTRPAFSMPAVGHVREGVETYHPESSVTAQPCTVLCAEGVSNFV
jgi:Mannosyltransferase OCH1 and related enzymes